AFLSMIRLRNGGAAWLGLATTGATGWLALEVFFFAGDVVMISWKAKKRGGAEGTNAYPAATASIMV
ncbi:MAG: hypothetical protein ACK59A_07455, partial [Cyanobacteriota bacterium]